MKWLYITLLVLLGVVSCFTPAGEDPFRGGPVPTGADQVLVCVVNESIDSYRIYVRSSYLGSVLSREARLLRIPRSFTLAGTTQLRASGGTGSATLYTDPMNLRSAPAWTWTLTESQITTQLNLLPGMDKRCAEKRKATGP